VVTPTIKQCRAAGEGQVGLLAGRDGFQEESRLGLNLSQEGLAIESDTAGFGGNGTDAAGGAVTHPLGADPKGRDGALDGAVVQVAVVGQPFAQAHNARERPDDAEAIGLRAGYQHAAVVGAKVNGAVDGYVRVHRPARPVNAATPLDLTLAHGASPPVRNSRVSPIPVHDTPGGTRRERFCSSPGKSCSYIRLKSKWGVV
jgi:hypothetical protein